MLKYSVLLSPIETFYCLNYILNELHSLEGGKLLTIDIYQTYCMLILKFPKDSASMYTKNA